MMAILIPAPMPAGLTLADTPELLESEPAQAWTWVDAEAAGGAAERTTDEPS